MNVKRKTYTKYYWWCGKNNCSVRHTTRKYAEQCAKKRSGHFYKRKAQSLDRTINIFIAYLNGEKQAEIARQYAISRTRVSEIVESMSRELISFSADPRPWMEIRKLLGTWDAPNDFERKYYKKKTRISQKYADKRLNKNWWLATAKRYKKDRDERWKNINTEDVA